MFKFFKRLFGKGKIPVVSVSENEENSLGEWKPKVKNLPVNEKTIWDKLAAERRLISMRTDKGKLRPTSEITIRIGMSRAKSFEAVLSRLREYPSFKEISADSFKYEVAIHGSNTEGINEIIGMVSKYKYKEYSLDSKKIEGWQLKMVADCMVQREKHLSPWTYCDIDTNGEVNRCRCRKLYNKPIRNGTWQTMNYEGTDARPHGELSSDGKVFTLFKDEVRRQMMEEAERVQLCPYFHTGLIEQYISALPDSFDLTDESREIAAVMLADNCKSGEPTWFVFQGGRRVIRNNYEGSKERFIASKVELINERDRLPLEL